MLEEAVCHLAGPRGTPRRESAQEGLKIVHGDSPAKNVLRRRDGEGRVSCLEGLWPQDLIQLRKWRELESGHRCVEAPTALAEESNLADRPLGAGPTAWDGRDLGRVGGAPAAIQSGQRSSLAIAAIE